MGIRLHGYKQQWLIMCVHFEEWGFSFMKQGLGLSLYEHGIRYFTKYINILNLRDGIDLGW